MLNVGILIFVALAIIITAVFSWGVASFVAWNNSSVKNEKRRAAVENARKIIISAVEATSQNFVDDLKKSGKFSPEKQYEAFKMTLEAVKQQLNAEAAEAINAITDDAQLWLASEIEKAVRNSKKEG